MSDFSSVKCLFCGYIHSAYSCPRVKAFDFDDNGMIKRVEFLTPADMVKPQPSPPPEIDGPQR